MWSQNALTDRLNLKWPILQAPMGWFSTPALAAAVSNAGGLGGLGMWGYTAEEAERRIAGFQQMSGRGLNANYPLWPEPGITPDTSEPMRRVCKRTSTPRASERYPSQKVRLVR
jgi:nitronate monooxygenase